jgi:preprotein translocase subunit SecD
VGPVGAPAKARDLIGVRGAIMMHISRWKVGVAVAVNVTIFIAAAVLFFIGTGPVRGFAVTLGIGIITTVFTAFTLTRLMVAWWVGWVRPQQLAIS